MLEQKQDSLILTENTEAVARIDGEEFLLSVYVQSETVDETIIYVWCLDVNEKITGTSHPRPPWAKVYRGKRFVPLAIIEGGGGLWWHPSGAEFLFPPLISKMERLGVLVKAHFFNS